MKINVNFLDEEIGRYLAGKKLIIGVYWEHEGQAYPMDVWSDFKCILGWWVTAVIELVDGANECEFMFMDGPYSIKAQYDRTTGKIFLKEGRYPDNKFEATTTINEIIEQLIQAYSKIHQALNDRKLNTDKEQEGFDRIMKILNDALSQAGQPVG
jgi:hypothetical protein